MKAVLLAALAFALAACSMPSTTVRTSDTRPSLVLQGAPQGSTAYVDGLSVGDADRYDGQPDVLLVEPGTHVVTVKGRDGSVIFERKVYVESEIKTLKVY